MGPNAPAPEANTATPNIATELRPRQRNPDANSAPLIRRPPTLRRLDWGGEENVRAGPRGTPGGPSGPRGSGGTDDPVDVGLGGESTGPRASASLRAHLERVAQRVPDEVEGDHDEDDGCTDGVDLPPPAIAEGRRRLGQHAPPVGAGWGQAEAQVTERRQEQDGCGDLERREHHDRADRVGNDVTSDDPVASAAHRLDGLHVLTRPQRERLTADETCRDQPADSGDHEDEQWLRAVEDRDERDQEEEHRHRQHDVDDAHHRRVEPPADVARHGSPDDADHRRNERGEQPDRERGLATVHEAAEDVEAGFLRAERMAGRARWQVLWRDQGRGLCGLVRVVEERGDPAEQDHEDDEGEADDGELVLEEDPRDLADDAAGRPRLTAGRQCLDFGGLGGGFGGEQIEPDPLGDVRRVASYERIVPVGSVTGAILAEVALDLRVLWILTRGRHCAPPYRI